MRLLLLASYLLWLAGCAALPPTERAGWQQHQRQLASLDKWTASGKVAVRSGEESGSASLTWLQLGVHSHVQLSGPMGFQATRIHSDGERLHVSQGEQETTVDLRSPDALRQLTGWDLPVRSLSWWLRGLPAPHSQARETVTDQLLRELRQDGWTIRYGGYSSYDGYTLPTRLDLEREDSRARVILRHWEPEDA